MKLVVGSIVAGVLVVGVVASSAQSLADVARNEEARRKNIKTPAKVYTDADVEKFAPVTASSQAAATTVTPLDAKGAPLQSATADGLPTDEAGWRARMQNARDGLDRDKLLLSALEQQAMRAALRKTAAGGGEASGEAGGDDITARAAEIKRLKTQMDANREVLANAEEDARRAGVPAGWVR
jgi:hypothetical protein